MLASFMMAQIGNSRSARAHEKARLEGRAVIVLAREKKSGGRLLLRDLALHLQRVARKLAVMRLGEKGIEPGRAREDHYALHRRRSPAPARNPEAETDQDLGCVTAEHAEAAERVFELLMGSDVAPRKEFIVAGAAELDHARIDV